MVADEKLLTNETIQNIHTAIILMQKLEKHLIIFLRVILGASLEGNNLWVKPQVPNMVKDDLLNC